MLRNWRSALCGVCAAMMLTACGAAKEEIQIVEQEDIAALPPSEDGNEEEAEEIEVSGEAEQPAPSEEDGKPKESAEAEEQPAVVTIEHETQEYKDGDILLLTAYYDHVTVSVEGNGEAARAIMEVFEKREQEFAQSVLELVEDAKEDMLVTDSGMSYMQGQGYETQRNDGRILSFDYGTEEFLGGAHGYYMEYGLNFDAKTGKVLTIEDIAQDMDAFQEISVQEMLRQCEDLRAQGVLFEEDMLPGGLEGKMEGDEWYFTADGIRFISNIYEIAPYAAGNFMFDIPYEMINDVLKEEYRG